MHQESENIWLSFGHIGQVSQGRNFSQGKGKSFFDSMISWTCLVCTDSCSTFTGGQASQNWETSGGECSSRAREHPKGKARALLGAKEDTSQREEAGMEDAPPQRGKILNASKCWIIVKQTFSISARGMGGSTEAVDEFHQKQDNTSGILQAEDVVPQNGGAAPGKSTPTARCVKMKFIYDNFKLITQ